jgi:RNA polymerase sigma-70 factor (ECF subfamily)
VVSDVSFPELMARVRGGDQDAMAAVVGRFTRRLLALARGRLARRKADPEDILQSVFRSFFDRYAVGQFEVESWDSLWGLLALITVRKCGHHVEYCQATCRDVGREHSPPAGWEALARDPTPAQAAMLTEVLERLLAGLHERERPILLLSLQGYSAGEVSAAVGRSERTVFRVLERVRKKLHRMHGGEG